MKISVITKLLVIIPAALLISSEKIRAAEPPRDSWLKSSDTALAKAKKLLEEGNTRRSAYKAAEKKIQGAEHELRILQKTVAESEKFFSQIQPDDIDAFPGVVAEAKKQTAALVSALPSTENAAAEAIAVQAACEQAENRVCDMAKQSASANEADVKILQGDATTLIAEASKKSQEAAGKAKVFQEAFEGLQVAQRALGSYVTAMKPFTEKTEGDPLRELDDTWTRANDAVSEARDAAKTGNTAAGNVRQICQQIRRLLRPYDSLSAVTATLNQADEVERDLIDLKFPDPDELLKGTRQRLDELKAAVKKIATLAAKSGAGAAWKEAVRTLMRAEKMNASVAGLANNSQATAALEHASKCLAEIQFKPLAADEAIVPNLSVFDAVSEMKAVLANAGLVAALVAAKEQPPSPTKEFKFAGQDPAPDTRVKRGTVVSIAFYQKFEATTSAVESDPFSGTWSGTIVTTDSKGKTSQEKKTYLIQKEGDGYVITVPNSKETIPLQLEAGKLTARLTFNLSADVGLSIGGKKMADAKGSAHKIVVKMTFEPAGQNLAMAITSTNDTKGTLESSGKGTFSRQ